MTVEEVFTDIYDRKVWGINSDLRGSSGPGSHPEYVKPYVRYVTRFLERKDIKSVVDVGCGDFQFARNMDWSKVNYTGIDCVKSVIDFNRRHFATDNVNFLHAELSDYDTLPNADLYIVKDVLQHLNNDTVTAFLDHLVQTKKAKYILVTNCCHQRYDDQDTDVGQTRPLHTMFSPLKIYNAIPKLRWGTKQTSLIVVSPC